VNGFLSRRVPATAAGAASAPAFASSSMSYFKTAGPAGYPVTLLGWGLGIISIGVLATVIALLLWGSLRRRQQVASPRALAVTADAGGMSWLYVGVGISTAVLIGCAVWTMFTIAAVAMPAHARELTLQVTAAQWWWGVRYQAGGNDPSQIFATANEIHIPVGRPVRLELNSIDVIHSFWIPRLAGKTDVIPGQTNAMWIQADSPGIYRGQCAEFCGAQHAHMAMEVVADEPAAFDVWKASQQRDAGAPRDAAAAAGAAVFEAHCAACHAVRGTTAGGIFGPDLTHLMSRKTIAAGLMPNTGGNLAAWISDPQSLKPGTRMPNPTLSGPELHAVVVYLNTLE
jgi:cytochrome c oxidase subunit II